MVLTQQQTDLLHAAIELALESGGKDPANDVLNAVADKVASAAFGENELVIMAWDPKYGHCSDCGAPAAYRLTNYSADSEAWLRCSTCAALAASEGERLVYLFEGDFDL